METMKVIDLLIKIAKGEIKDKTIFRKNWGDMYRDFYYDGSEENQLQCLKNCSDDYPIYDDIKLNDEIEIIEDTPKEDKKIEKFKVIKDNEGGNVLLNYDNKNYIISVVDAIMLDKINEIINKINGE